VLVLRSKYDRLYENYHSLVAKLYGAESTLEVLKTTVFGLKDEKIAERDVTIKKLEDSVQRERIRGDQAVDNLLSRIANAPPISDPSFSGTNKTETLMKEMDEMFEEDPDVVKGIIKRIEAGDTSVMEEAGEQRYHESGSD